MYFSGKTCLDMVKMVFGTSGMTVKIFFKYKNQETNIYMGNTQQVLTAF